MPMRIKMGVSQFGSLAANNKVGMRKQALYEMKYAAIGGIYPIGRVRTSLHAELSMHCD
jgi:hypothetical protein